MVLPKSSDSQESKANILIESHMIKFLQNKEYVVDIFEEIIEFNPKKMEIENYIVLVE